MEVKNENRREKEEGGLGWGKSIPVPSVQEMVRNDQDSVPERYIQDYENRPHANGLAPPTSYEIPIIDFSLLAKKDEDELKKLDLACKEWGFFQLINHGVEELIERMKTIEAECFDLPLEIKKKYAMAENDVQGYGQAFVISEEQKLDWADIFFLMTYPPQERIFKKWPLTVPGFRETVEEYTGEVCRISEEIFANLSVLMKIEEDSLKEMHKGIRIGMRMNYYPICSKPELVIGVSPHSDSGSISLLVQDDDVTGLEIRHQGQWIPVKSQPGAFVVNIADVVEIWSNGVYKSVEHRAVTNAKKARMSIAMFVMLNDEAEIGPVDTMLRDHGPAKYKRMKFVDYMRLFLGRKMEGRTTDILKAQDQ